MNKNGKFDLQTPISFDDQPPVTCAQMKEIERIADASGLSYYQMMENAGSAAAALILEGAKERSMGGVCRVVLFCGKGNNGGDGYVAARKLFEAGADVAVIAVEGAAKTRDATTNARIVSAMKIPVYQWPVSGTGLPSDAEAIYEAVSAADILVDAIYGTGFHGQLSEPALRCTSAINKQRPRVLVYALDIPSGIAGDSGEIAPGAVKADYTVAFHRRKPVHTMEPAQTFCGRIVTVGIGID